MFRIYLCLNLVMLVSAMADSSLPKLPFIVAHRGNSSEAPENTAAAVRSGIAAGADLVEFDVRVSADGVLLLFHDKDLQRITGDAAAFDSLTLAQARQLDVGAWFTQGTGSFQGERPPTLAEAIFLCLEGGVTPLIERKSGDAAAFIHVIRGLKAEDRIIVQAFDWDFLREIRELEPTIRIGALGDKLPDDERIAQLNAIRPDWIGWNQNYLDAGAIRRFQEGGASIAVWTVNDMKQVRLFAEQGAQAIITDRVRQAREVLAGLPQ